MQKDEKYLLATYGSLKQGYFNEAYLIGSEYIGDIVTKPLYELVDFGPYPAVLEGGTTGIHCEVYKVDKQTLLSIARMEMSAGYDVVIIDTKYGKACLCIYTYNACVGYDRIASGRWIQQESMMISLDNVAYATGRRNGKAYK